MRDTEWNRKGGTVAGSPKGSCWYGDTVIGDFAW